MSKKIALTLLWIGCCASVSAQSSRYLSATQGMSFEQLARMALSRNADLQGARESVRQAEARLTQARLWPNPSVDLSKKTDAVFANEGDRGYSVGLSQPVELGGKRANRTRMAETSIEVVKADVAEVERQLIGRLRLLFAEAQGVASRVDLFERLDRTNDQTIGVMNVRLRAGDASRLDSQLLQAQTNQVRAERLLAENQLAGLVLQIRTLVSLSPDEPLLLKPGQQIADVPGTEEATVTRAIESRPDVKAARLREELADAGISLARSQAVPDVTAFARYGQESLLGPPATGTQTRSFEREKVLEFGMSIPLPIFNREQGNISEAASRRSQARAERESLEVTVRREVALAIHRYETARKSLDILQSGVLEQNQASVRIVQLAYDLGELRFLDIVNQQRVLIDAETRVVNAQTELNAARADLQNAIGGPINP
ncbi:MAG: TolC family protein [Acidobacteria bacterium]|nr:TolC family protein [Acidobacteriota bacterium]